MPFYWPLLHAQPHNQLSSPSSAVCSWSLLACCWFPASICSSDMLLLPGYLYLYIFPHSCQLVVFRGLGDLPLRHVLDFYFLSVFCSTNKGLSMVALLAFTMFRALRLMLPPIPSTAPLPWDVAKKCHIKSSWSFSFKTHNSF